MRSAKGISIRTPWAKSRSVPILDSPAYLLPRAHGTKIGAGLMVSVSSEEE